MRVLRKSCVEVLAGCIKVTIVNKAGIDIVEGVFDKTVYCIFRIDQYDVGHSKVVIYGDIEKQEKRGNEKISSVAVPMYFINCNELQSQIISFKEKSK